MEAVALVALVLGFLPVALVTLVVVTGVVIVALLVGLLWLLEQPPSAWLFALSLAFNAVVLIPLWIVSWLAAHYRPNQWEQAETHVLVFSAVFVLPTILFYAMWQRARGRSARSP